MARSTYATRLARYEKKAAARFNLALRTQVAAVIDYVEREGPLAAELSLAALVREDPVRRAFEKAWPDTFVSEAKAKAREVSRALPRKSFGKALVNVGFFSTAWRKYIRQHLAGLSARKITRITETTREEIRSVMAEARGRGGTVQETARAITDRLGRADFTRKRARTIARTESNAAANMGGAISAESSNIVLTKKWKPRLDGRERDAHRAMADTPPIDPSQPFTVGGESLMQPGDPAGSGWNVINCRCTVLYEPVFDQDGLPVFRTGTIGGVPAGKDLFSV